MEVQVNGVAELDNSLRCLEKVNWLQFQPIVKTNQTRIVDGRYLSLKPISEQAERFCQDFFFHIGVNFGSLITSKMKTKDNFYAN